MTSNYIQRSVTLKLHDNHSRLVSKDNNLIESIRTKFTFYNDDHIRRFKCRFRGKGTRVEFITKDGFFPSGLVSSVTGVLSKMGVPYACEDQRTLFHENLDFDTISSETLSPHITLHNYQVEASNVALAKKRGVLKCATGGGKTIMFAAIIKAMKENYPTMVLCRNKNLVSQTYETLLSSGIVNVGRVNMDHFEPNQITCSTVQSLHKLDSLVGKTKVLIIDEVHEWATTESMNHLQKFTNATYKLGFSATPFKARDYIHNYRVQSWLGPQICDIGIDFLRDKAILSEAHVHFYPVGCPHSIGRDNISYLEAETEGIIDNEPFHKKVVDIVNNIQEGRILILVKRLAHGDKLKDMIPNAHWIRGEDSSETREKVLQELRQSDQKKVVAIMSSIGFYGLNVFVHHLINASGGKEPNMLIQKIGRGLRKSFDKDKLEYYDFLFQGNNYLAKHSTIRADILKKEGHQVTIES